MVEVKNVLYNQGGHVAHISIKIDGAEDSFNAFVEAANLAHKHGGQVEALYEDNKWGSRTRIGGIERAGLVLEFGSLDDSAKLSAEIKRLREGIAEYLTAEPKKAGHAAAHRKLAELLGDADSPAYL